MSSSLQKNRGSSRPLLAAVLFALAGCGLMHAVSRPVPPITSIAQLRHLSAAQASTYQPVAVHLRGVVTYYDVVGPNLFIQDATGGAWVDLQGLKETPPRPGQLLDLWGTVGLGFSPYVAKPSWKVLGNVPFPKPVPLPYDQAATGLSDGEWVSLEGVVRSFVQQAEGNVLVIDVATPTASFKVRVPDYTHTFPMSLIDAKVRFTGVLGSSFNRSHQLVAIHLLMPSLEFAKITTPAPSDPFAVTTSPITSIRRFTADLPDVHRVKITGTVTARFPGLGLYMTDKSGGVYVESQDGAPVVPGDLAEVIGFPAVGSYSPILKSGSIRPLNRHINLPTTRITGHAALQGSFDAQLVSVSGIIHSRYTRGSETILVLESTDHVDFETSIQNGFINAPVGSRVDATGICSVKADENGNPSTFEIVLRTPADVHVISSPPWLNLRRALLGLAIAFISIVLATIWVGVLRRKVRRQMETIRADLQAKATLQERYRQIFEGHMTGLYLADLSGHFIECNAACAITLGFSGPDDLFAHAEDARRILCEIHDTCRNPLQPLTNAERPFTKADGKPGWLLCNSRIVPREGGDIHEGGFVDISVRKTAEQQVQFLAYYDPLTHLPNRTLLKKRLAEEIARVQDSKHQLALLFVDLDWFKNINDSLGHSVGDGLLNQVASRLRSCARECDIVARLSGDEFVLVINRIHNMADVTHVADRVLEQLSAPFHVDCHRLQITCSIGISIFPEHGLDIEALVKNADAAMYASKESGRSTYRFFDHAMGSRAARRLTIENLLRSALETDEFHLEFQPELDLRTGKIACFEALLRWNNPTLGVIPPDQFIPIAEETGIIVPLGAWVLRTACAEARRWLNQGFTIPVAVNVSAVQIRHEGFVEMVAACLEQSKLPAPLLEIELTESALLSRNQSAFDSLRRLRDLGVTLAMDDFGTGYSGLSYLKAFPMDKVKIDRSFVRDLNRNAEDAGLIAAVVAVAGARGMIVTAEGVETEEQLTLLRTLECGQAQGFHLSRPIYPSQIRDCLSQFQERFRNLNAPELICHSDLP